LGETFIPFVQERDTIGRIFKQTLSNNRIKSLAKQLKARAKSQLAFAQVSSTSASEDLMNK